VTDSRQLLAPLAALFSSLQRLFSRLCSTLPPRQSAPTLLNDQSNTERLQYTPSPSRLTADSQWLDKVLHRLRLDRDEKEAEEAC
jgi:hypothetical protein